MMRTSHLKYIVFIVMIVFVLIMGVFLFERKNTGWMVMPVDFDGYVRNESWQTDYSEYTPYRIGDTLEYIYVFPGGENAVLSLDINTLLSTLKDAILELNGVSITPDMLSQIESKWQTQILKIRGKAGSDSLGANEDVKKLIFIKKIPSISPVTPSLTGAIGTGIIETTSASGISLSSTNFSSNENEVLIISGSGVISLMQVIIGDIRLPLHMDGTRAFTLIDKGTFGSGTYFISLVTKDGKLIPIDSGINFSYDSAPIRISAITPNTVSKSKYGYVVLQWNGFRKLVSLQLENGRIFKKADYRIIDDMVVVVTVPTGLTEWTYYFNMMDPSGIYTTKTPITITK